MKIRPDTLYLIDNGACYCGEHLPATARYTGRDISGQPILPITPDVVVEADAVGGDLFNGFLCDEPRCDRKPSALWRA